ncbi:hypothetical protein ABJ851_004036 [Shigella flexneri]|nr:hypothetical protein [Escherichia coli]
MKAFKFSFLLVSNEYFHGEQHDLLLLKNQTISMITGIDGIIWAESNGVMTIADGDKVFDNLSGYGQKFSWKILVKISRMDCWDWYWFCR